MLTDDLAAVVVALGASMDAIKRAGLRSQRGIRGLRRAMRTLALSPARVQRISPKGLRWARYRRIQVRFVVGRVSREARTDLDDMAQLKFPA